MILYIYFLLEDFCDRPPPPAPIFGHFKRYFFTIIEGNESVFPETPITTQYIRIS
jgi:hypothetical protein